MKADLPDLTTFMLGTGVRIGESLTVLGSQVNLSTGQVDISHQIIRVKGKGLVRIRTKSRAGERLLVMPSWCVQMVRRRLMNGARLDQPLFADSNGGSRQRASRPAVGSIARRQ